MNFYAKLVRSTNVQTTISMAEANWETEYGALIAVFAPTERMIELYEP